ncbi:hypothetical protein [Sorangium sp. So ce1182]|uniref:hypothetical protein n=1 Tax=Sorangium sp. So ce1182 TaxID=3133334 RepID=UPI003F643516
MTENRPRGAKMNEEPSVITEGKSALTSSVSGALPPTATAPASRIFALPYDLLGAPGLYGAAALT